MNRWRLCWCFFRNDDDPLLGETWLARQWAVNSLARRGSKEKADHLKKKNLARPRPEKKNRESCAEKQKRSRI